MDSVTRFLLYTLPFAHLAASAVVPVVSCTSSQTEFLVNGSFEDGFTDWTYTIDYPYKATLAIEEAGASGSAFSTAADGDYYLQTGSSSQYFTLEQTVTGLTPGKTYTVSYSYATVPTSFNTGVCWNWIYQDSTSTQLLYYTLSMGTRAKPWTKYSYSWTPTAGSHTLIFTFDCAFENTGYIIGWDNFQVEDPVPTASCTTSSSIIPAATVSSSVRVSSASVLSAPVSSLPFSSARVSSIPASSTPLASAHVSSTPLPASSSRLFRVSSALPVASSPSSKASISSHIIQPSSSPIRQPSSSPHTSLPARVTSSSLIRRPTPSPSSQSSSLAVNHPAPSVSLLSSSHLIPSVHASSSHAAKSSTAVAQSIGSSIASIETPSSAGPIVPSQTPSSSDVIFPNGKIGSTNAGSEPTPTGPSGESSGEQFTTSTILSTRTATVTQCPSTVTDCPASAKSVHLTTETIVVSTTVCRVTAAEATATIPPSGSQGETLTTETIFSARTSTVYACPSTVTDCPLRSKTASATTETLVLGTTVYPVSQSHHAAPTTATTTDIAKITSVPQTDVQGASLTTETIYQTSVSTVYACPPDVTNCPLREKTASLSTVTYVAGTTVYPTTQAHVASAQTTNTALQTITRVSETNVQGSLTTETIYRTSVSTVYACPPEVTNCPLRQKTASVTTKTFVAGTTVYPVSAGAASAINHPATVTEVITIPVSGQNVTAPEAVSSMVGGDSSEQSTESTDASGDIALQTSTASNALKATQSTGPSGVAAIEASVSLGSSAVHTGVAVSALPSLGSYAAISSAPADAFGSGSGSTGSGSTGSGSNGSSGVSGTSGASGAGHLSPTSISSIVQTPVASTVIAAAHSSSIASSYTATTSASQPLFTGASSPSASPSKSVAILGGLLSLLFLF